MIKSAVAVFWAAALSIASAVAADKAGGDENTSSRPYLLQIGPGPLLGYIGDDALLNKSKSWGGRWRFENTKDRSKSIPYATEHLNAFGYPKSLPPSAGRVRGPGVLPDREQHREIYAGSFIMEWAGDGYGFLDNQPRDMQTRVGQRKLTFAIRRSEQPLNNRQVVFSQLKGDGVRDLAVYRQEHRKLFKAGRLWDPRFLESIKGYDIIRTMDFQLTNASPVTRFSDVARLEDAAWASGFSAAWPPQRRYGAPYEALFALGAESGAQLWIHIPPMIGADYHLADPSVRKDKAAKTIPGDEIRALTAPNASQILNHPAWDEFAAELADRLIASEYPEDRMLYIELGNELWNYAYPFYMHTHYAGGIGKGVKKAWDRREGYGLLSARWATAFEKALNARGRKQKITYVLASQTVWDAMTSTAATGYAFGLKKWAGEDGARLILEKSGVALTTYHHCIEPYIQHRFRGLSDDAIRARFEAAIKDDPSALTRDVKETCLDPKRNKTFSPTSIVGHWRAHEKKARAAGLKLIGAYEGGSHDVPPQALRESQVFNDWFVDFHWGPEGASIVRAVNDAIIEAFPGVILSNYSHTGVPNPGAPWVDGHYAAPTEMSKMWDDYRNRAK